MSEMTLTQEDFAVRCQRLVATAKQLFGTNPDWVTFFREILGISGKARQVFREQSEFVAFERTPEFQEIQQMVNQLRGRRIPGSNIVNEPTRVITVRLPESLHEALKQEATDHNTSMNKLCISKLLQVLSEQDKESGRSMAARSANVAIPATSPNFRSTFGVAPPQSNAAGGMGTR